MRGKPDKTRSASHQAVGIVAGCGASALSGLPITIQSVLFHKLRFQFHRTKTVDFAIDVMVAFNQADVFHFGANFQHRRATFHLQIFNDGNAVAVSQQIAPLIAGQQSMQSDIDGIKCKLPNTVPVQWPNIVGVNTDLYKAAAYGAAAGSYAGYGCGYNAGFWN